MKTKCERQRVPTWNCIVSHHSRRHTLRLLVGRVQGADDVGIPLVRDAHSRAAEVLATRGPQVDVVAGIVVHVALRQHGIVFELTAAQRRRVRRCTNEREETEPPRVHRSKRVGSDDNTVKQEDKRALEAPVVHDNLRSHGDPWNQTEKRRGGGRHKHNRTRDSRRSLSNRDSTRVMVHDQA